MEIEKAKKVWIIPKDYKGDNTAINMIVHWDKELGQYVLCMRRFFGYVHFTIEECEDMIRILKRYNGN